MRRGMIQFAWRFLIHQKGSALAGTVVSGERRRRQKAQDRGRKLLIALWRFLTTGDLPQGVILRPAS